MRKEITLKLPPFSINAMYYADFRAKTPEAREWTGQVFWQLNRPDNQIALKELRDYFDPKLHAFGVEVSAFYPRDVFFNKEGTVSGRTIDISNFEKTILDLLFGTKYFDKVVPNGVKNINFDDRYIQYCISKKLPHDMDYKSLVIVVEIISLDSFRTV